MQNAPPTIDAQRPPRQRKRGRETEQRFLAAANEVFWANGFAGSTIAQIIGESGLSVGSFYHRFTGKEELLKLAALHVVQDFERAITGTDYGRAANGDLFTLFYRLALIGRKMISRHRGIYRATVEISQSEIAGFGRMTSIAPLVVQKLTEVIAEYDDQLASGHDDQRIRSVVQLVAMTVMQTELGLGPLFPAKNEAFAADIARAACGIMGYRGQTAAPLHDITERPAR